MDEKPQEEDGTQVLATPRLATLNGHKLPSQFRRDNPHITDHLVLALACTLQR